MNKQILANRLIRSNRTKSNVQSSLILVVTLGATLAISISSLVV